MAVPPLEPLSSSQIWLGSTFIPRFALLPQTFGQRFLLPWRQRSTRLLSLQIKLRLFGEAAVPSPCLHGAPLCLAKLEHTLVSPSFEWTVCNHKQFNGTTKFLRLRPHNQN